VKSREHKLGQGRECFGTAAIYAARPNEWIYVQGDYRFDLNGNTFPKESRAYRNAAKRRRKKVTSRPEALRDETIVVFGPDVAPLEAAKLLRKLAAEIEKRGIFAGFDHLHRKVFDRVVQI
jgi:hypothetical protein